MCILAIILTRSLMAPLLDEGDEMSCKLFQGGSTPDGQIVYYTSFRILSPFHIIFSVWFRLILGIAYVNMQQHMGFLTLQLVLVAIAMLNVVFIVEAKVEYKMFCGRTKLFALAYLFCNTVISGIKIYLTCYVVFVGGYPS